MNARNQLVWMVIILSFFLCTFGVFRLNSSRGPSAHLTDDGGAKIHTAQNPDAAPDAGDAVSGENALAVDAPVSSVSPSVILSPEEIDAALGDFAEWSRQYLSGDPAQRAALEREGVALAGKRRDAMKQLIQKNPRHAVESAVPRVMRQDLPASITNLLEKPVSAKGDLNVYYGKPAPGVRVAQEELTLRYFEGADSSYRAYVYGDLESVTSRTGFPVNGFAIDGHLALAQNAVRRLEVGERIPAGAPVKETCPVSGETTIAVGQGEAVTGDTPTVEIAGELITLCNGSHVTVLEDDYRTYIQSNGPGGGGFFIDNFPGTASRAIGNLRCLYIRVTYPDQMEQPNTEEQAYSDMRDNARFYLENSYGKMTQTATVTPVLVLPQTLAWYKAKDSAAGGTIDCLGLIHNDSRAVAKASGYDVGQFDCVIVRINKGPRLEGISWGGGSSVWITWNGMDVMNHEIGHSLGLNHANYWTSLDGTAYGYGQNEEYGNIFDVMGKGGGFNDHYNSVCKRQLNWLAAEYTHNPVTNGTYRLYAYDQPRLEEGKRYAMRVAKDSRFYNLEYHPAAGGYLADGATVIYSGLGSNAGHLVDTTPGSLAAKNDSPIALGRTYSDPESDMHFTVVSKNGTVPESIDVVYNKGPFPGNVAPTATLTSTTTTIAVGGSVTFTATASDANGDALAYHWEFSDGEGGTNSAVYTRTFPVAAQVTAMLTVSDMKGGSVRRSTVINVGSHGKQTISGTITAGGVGVPGVYVSGNGKGCYTNADGTYSLSGIATGSQALTATLAGYTFSPSGFTNPLNVVAGTNTANWTATTGTFVTLAKIADATEGGGSGTFRFTRTGSTTAALTVLVAPVSGSAVKGTDYTFSPDYTASGSYYSFTIPAGSSTLNVTVAPTNDTIAEGPETIRLQVASATGYYSSSTNAQVMTLADNDTSLPQVSVIASDPYASEAPAGDNATFTFARTGATTSSLNLTVAWSGTATNGADYSTLSTTVTIPSGQASTTVTLTPANDTAIEIPETAVATITASAAYVLDTSATSATATISDDDTPVVTVSVADGVASEVGGDAGLLLIHRTGSTAAALKVYYGVSGSAAHGTDYSRLTGEVTIPAGATSAPVVISPVDDDIAEPSEDVTLMLTTFNNAYSVGTSNSGVVGILDNGDVPLVNVRATDGTEGGSAASFIFRTIGNGTGSITVNYTISGTATSGSDFTALSGSISVPAGGSSDTTLTVPVTNDTTPEPTETLILTITPSANYRVYNDGAAQGVIYDNDSGDRVMVSKFNQQPTEAGTPGAFYISRTGTTGGLTVNYAMSGTATNGSDYSTLSGSVLIPAGSAGVDLALTPINDTAVEGTETVTLTIAPGAGYGVDIPQSATYTITDNETIPRTVGFQSTTLSTNELPGILGQYRDIPVVLSASHTGTVTVDYYAGGGSAAGDNEDWAFVDAANGNAVIRQGTLSFAPGVTSQNIRIRVNNDGVREANETAVIQLARAYNAALGNAANTVTIADTPAPHALRLITAATTRSEADGNEPMLQVVLDRPAESAVSVSYAATGTATSAADYTLTGTSLSFAVGEQIKPIPLTLLTDAAIEAPETIIVSLSNPVGASLSAPAAHIITLTDASAPQVASQFVSATSSQPTGTLITTATATLSSGRSISNWSIVSGNTDNLFTLNSSNGQLTLTTPASLPNPGGVQLIIKATDNAGASGIGAINIICNAPANAVVERRWTDTSAYFSEDWSGVSSYSGSLPTLTSATNVSNNYSRRLTGYLKPQTSGNYTFWIAGDDECRLYLSTDGYEANKIKIAHVVGATANQAWDTYDSQKSVTIPLVANKVYWIEAQQMDVSGADSVAVAWSGPSIARALIPSSVMVATAPGISFPLPESGIGTNAAPTISNVADRSTDVGTSTGAIAFTVGDAETPADSLVVSASSSNLTLLPQSGIVLGGSGANRTVTLTPAQGQTGTATVTLTVADGMKSASDTFLLAVGSSQIVAFQSASASGTETTSPVQIQVTMSAPKATAVTVDYAVTGGSATAGSDYILSNGTLTFAAGQTSKTISLAVINDSLGENDETVEIALGNAVGAVIGTNATHTYTILNEDTDFSIVATDANAAEAGPDAGSFTITRSGLTAASVTVNLARSGTATNAADYVSIPSTITFGAGETTKTITVTPLDDVIVEAAEAMTLAIAAGTGYSVGSPASATVTITDNDVDISIAATTPNTAEGGAAGVFTLTRTGVTTGTTVVNLALAESSTAISATDYTAIASTITFSANQTSKTINVSPVNDAAYEDAETVILTIAPGVGYQPANPSSATVTIADNDKPTVSIASSVSSATEGGAVPTLTFSRTGVTHLGPLTVLYALTGTAAVGGDYAMLAGSVTIPQNQASATIPIEILQDNVTEASETLTVTVSSNAAYNIAAAPANSATMTILDDTEAVVLNISATDGTASEPAKGDGTGAFTITRSGSTTSAVTVNYVVSGSATPGSDFTGVSGSVVIPSSQTSATVTLNPVDDTEAEVDETVVVTLQAATGYTVGNTSSATVNLYDDEPTQVRIEVTDAKCIEPASSTGSADPGTFTLRRLGNRTAELKVNYNRAGSATPATDFVAFSSPATINAATPTATLQVAPVYDTLTEGTETVTITLAAGTGYTVNAQNTETLEIRDSLTADVTVSAQDPNCAEAASPDSGNFRISRSAASASSLTVSYTITGTATNGVDYTSLTGTATIAANATTVDVAVIPANDGALEGSESVILTLTGAAAAYDIGDGRSATIWIKDDEAPTITLAATDGSAAEADGGATNQGLWTFTASFAPTANLTINYTVGTNNGIDCVYLPGSIVLPAGQTTVTLPLIPVDDELPEGAENVGVTLAYGGKYNLATTAAVNVSIAASDTPIATVRAFDANAVENPTKTGRFVVTFNKVVLANTSVTYTVEGTASATSDYTALTGTVTVNNGANSAIITVTPLNDTLSEGPETVTITLNSGAGYTLGSTASATVTIEDDELVAPLATWKQAYFGGQWADGAVSGDSVDYDGDGLANLMEYALGTIPTTATAGASKPQHDVASGPLRLSFTRVVANNDITIIIQGADSPAGPWTDLASSINGAATAVLASGAVVNETGSGTTRTVSVGDTYATGDPAHPKRFMRIVVVR